MKHITPARLALARRRTALAIGDYTGYSLGELIQEAAGLHQTLATCHQFGRVAELGVRHLVIERLLALDAEQERRLLPRKPASSRTPDPLIAQPPAPQPAVAA